MRLNPHEATLKQTSQLGGAWVRWEGLGSGGQSGGQGGRKVGGWGDRNKHHSWGSVGQKGAREWGPKWGSKGVGAWGLGGPYLVSHLSYLVSLSLSGMSSPYLVSHPLSGIPSLLSGIPFHLSDIPSPI